MNFSRTPHDNHNQRDLNLIPLPDQEGLYKSPLLALYHSIGTCKLGIDAMAVVDDLLRPHNIIRLRVIDASVMLAIILGNTNAGSIMIGEKGAELV